jgi:hypothetical protein
MAAFPLYHCATCGARHGYRTGAWAPWTCGGCRPPFLAGAPMPAGASGPADAAPASGIRPSLAFSDAALVAAENAELCASRERFLKAAAAPRTGDYHSRVPRPSSKRGLVGGANYGIRS